MKSKKPKGAKYRNPFCPRWRDLLRAASARRRARKEKRGNLGLGNRGPAPLAKETSSLAGSNPCGCRWVSPALLHLVADRERRFASGFYPRFLEHRPSVCGYGISNTKTLEC